MDETRYFLIKHKDCGCMIINSNQFIRSFEENKKDCDNDGRVWPIVVCPSCGERAIDAYALKEFLEKYNTLAKKDFTIREIPSGDLDFESLRQFLVTV